MNQAAVILGHMMRHGGISRETARDLYGIVKLSARIREMRMLGLNVRLESGVYRLEAAPGTRRMKKEIGEDDLFPEYGKE